MFSPFSKNASEVLFLPVQCGISSEKGQIVLLQAETLVSVIISRLFSILFPDLSFEAPRISGANAVILMPSGNADTMRSKQISISMLPPICSLYFLQITLVAITQTGSNRKTNLYQVILGAYFFNDCSFF